MQRIVAVFTVLCMVLIAGSVGVALYLYLRLSGAEAATLAVAVLTGLAIYNTVTTRVRDRHDVSRQIADLSKGTADLARQVAEVTRRVAGVDGKFEAAAERTRLAVAPLSDEIEELGTLVKALAEQVAAHESRLAAAGRTAPAAAASTPGPAAMALPRAEAPTPAALREAPRGPAVPEPQAAPEDSGAFANLGAEAVLSLIRGALEANRLDLYLQPIVTLPQRKVRYYEALSRLRGADGALVMPTDFLPRAEAGGLMPAIDNALLFRCVQVVRRMLLKNRDVGLFCNLSTATLADGVVFPQVLEFMEANRALAPSLVFEFSQRAVRAMGPIENESLAALAGRGFRFSMDNVTDLRMEGRDLSERGFRFVKVPAELLLNRTGAALASDIHPADLSDLLGRFGIDLVAERIESEAIVVDLLDHDVRFGQGFLFSPPRPVRQEALQGIGERGDVLAAEAQPAAGGATAAARGDTGRAAGTGKSEPVRGRAQLARPAVAIER